MPIFILHFFRHLWIFIWNSAFFSSTCGFSFEIRHFFQAPLDFHLKFSIFFKHLWIFIWNSAFFSSTCGFSFKNLHFFQAPVALLRVNGIGMIRGVFIKFPDCVHNFVIHLRYRRNEETIVRHFYCIQCSNALPVAWHVYVCTLNDQVYL